MNASWLEWPDSGGVAQLGERCVRNAEVGSSILLLSTTRIRPDLLCATLGTGLQQLQSIA